MYVPKNRFDDFHYICPYITPDESKDVHVYMEVPDDGSRHERCPIVDEITEKEYKHLICFRENRRILDRIMAREKALGKKIVSDDEIGTPACTEDGEYLVGCEPEGYYDRKSEKKEIE